MMGAQGQSTVADLAVPGLVIRPYAGPDDVPAFVRIINAEYEADGVEERLTEDGERAWLAETSDQFDPARDVSIAELDGRPVAVATRSWADMRDGSGREYRVGGTVDPAYRGRGIGQIGRAHV